ncbi:hypothetical protein TWF788_009517 [Orbilia oligospora]|uniref:Uncharacterized protein n=1 Tax=Orbilia oligospora TaxID=2813651 RepID=A0A7C8PH41_ORBOL|nr:hypothetical protein TWF788_009517 [Orbilia oligospora]
MAAPDEGVVIASGAVLGDTLLFRATTTLSGVILIGMRAGRVVDMNSDRTRTNAQTYHRTGTMSPVPSPLFHGLYVVNFIYRNTGPNSWDLQGANSYFNDKISSYKCWLDPLTFCGDVPCHG